MRARDVRMILWYGWIDQGCILSTLPRDVMRILVGPYTNVIVRNVRLHWISLDDHDQVKGVIADPLPVILYYIGETHVGFVTRYRVDGEYIYITFYLDVDIISWDEVMLDTYKFHAHVEYKLPLGKEYMELHLRHVSMFPTTEDDKECILQSFCDHDDDDDDGSWLDELSEKRYWPAAKLIFTINL